MKSEFIIAVHALVYMNHVGRNVSSEELSINIGTNAVRVRKVMASLKKANIITTKEGKSGGYHMLRKANDIQLSELVDILHTDIVSTGWRSGNSELPCSISNNMMQVIDECITDMDAICRRYLESQNIEDIEKRLYQIQESDEPEDMNIDKTWMS